MRNILYAGLTIAAIFVFFRWLFPVTLPFLIAFVLARLMEPGVSFMQRRWRVPRKAGSALLTVLLVAAILTALWFLLSWLFSEINDLIERAPELIARFPEMGEGLSARVERWIAASPPSLHDTLRRGLDGVVDGLSAVPVMAIGKLTDWVGAFAVKLPYIMLFIFALVLSTFLISSDYPNISRTLLRPFSERTRNKILSVKNQLANTLGKWLKAQGMMMLINFGVLLLGFMILRIPTALMAASLIALLDALPVIGAGICLIPWAVISLISGNTFQAAGMGVIYCVLVMLRGFIEPKLVGSQIGLGALPTFIAMYVGFVAAGVLGMLTFPILLITIKQIWEARSKPGYRS
jgi:sporulation integral membrane protein YtvI